MIDNLSLSSLFIEMYINKDASKPIAIGTAFTVRPNNRDEWFLITNWHCVTGRNPETNEPLSSLADPSHLKVYFHAKNKIGHWEKILINLYDEDGDKKWIEHEKGSKIDLVAIKISAADNVSLYNFADSINGNDLIVDPGDNCSIIGFPKGLTYGGKFPIWKTGHIATDYGIDWDGLPLFYVDATTRKGMSGSPVVAIKDGLCRFERNNLISGKFTRFMGIYSGRVDETSEIGRVWKPNALYEILNKYYS